MTNEQAINLLKNLRKSAVMRDGDIVAMEMAIKALEQEPCDVSDTNVGKTDAVSKKAAIEKIHWLGIDNDTAIMCDLAIRALPSVTPKQSGWHYTDLPPSDDPYKRYLVVYSPYDRNYGRNTAPRFEIADYYKGDGLYNDKPWHLTISHSVMEKEILAWKDIGIVDEVMQGAKMVKLQESEE